MVTVARIDNIEELTHELLAQGNHFAELSDSSINATELVAILIGQGKSLKEGIELVQRKVKGSCSMLVLTDRAIYAARDRFGRTPITIGKNDKGYICASESSSFDNLGYSFVRDLGPGEIVQLTADGVRQVTPPGDAASRYVHSCGSTTDTPRHGTRASTSRTAATAAAPQWPNATQTSSPTSPPYPRLGRRHAIGYSNEKRIPYKRPFVKYTPTWPRSFMPQDQKRRDLVAKMKLLPNSRFTHGQKIVFMDDSIVRGTQLKDNVVKLLDAGVKL